MFGNDFDVVIVGSGPAGVSAAIPLVQSGVRVMMVDGGRVPDVLPPSVDFVTARRSDHDQWKWMVGERFHSLENRNSISPKMRVPTQAYVFEGFAHANRIVAEEFVAIGSLAQGGLSNAWGCGVAALTPEDAIDFPFPYPELEESYAVVSKRMGVSGAIEDDMSAYFGVDRWAASPIEIDSLHRYMFERYASRRDAIHGLGIRVGRSRVAVLNEPMDDRSACDRSGNCLFGCARRSLYSSAFDLQSLLRLPNFRHVSGFIVDKVAPVGDGWEICGQRASDGTPLKALGKKVLLAAGTLATTRMALDVLKFTSSVRLLSSPTAAFLVWLPRKFGRSFTQGYGLGQLSFSLTLDDRHSAFGSTFSTTGLPVSEFASYAPFNLSSSIDILRRLLPSCVVGNVFLPGDFSDNSVCLMNSELRIQGRSNPRADEAMDRAARQLRKAFAKLGGLILPSSFSRAPAGADIHYAGTLPMKAQPAGPSTSSIGELNGAPGLYVIDGACLPSLLEKSHTLTIMANADRIGRHLSRGVLSLR